MSIEFNHTIVWSRDSKASAAFVADILALPWQINGLVGFAAASFVWGAKRWRRLNMRIGGMILGAGFRPF